MVTTRRGRSRGFTLIELMIVISLILILVSISIPAYLAVHPGQAESSAVVGRSGSGGLYQADTNRSLHGQERYLDGGPGRLYIVSRSTRDRNYGRAQRIEPDIHHRQGLQQLVNKSFRHLNTSG